ncbi:MAG: hypothetical protein K6G80_01650 [Treponema sp.]|nr:hypothetical protein [Treponema sp.]
MQSKLLSLLAVIALLLFFWGVPLYAQEQVLQTGAEETPESETALTNTVSQPFSWESAGDVLKYAITITRFDEKTGSFTDYFFHETTEEETEACLIHLEPILPVGRYRSEIKVYNVLGQPEEDLTSYDEFTVRKAYKPHVRSISYPLYMRSTIYLDDVDNNGIIEAEGQNLFLPGKTENALEHTRYYLSGSHTVEPVSVVSHDDAHNRKITFAFDMKQLDVGTYWLYAQDASGLHSEESPSNTITVKFRKWMDVDIEGGYAFPFVLHDETFPEYMAKQLPMTLQGKLVVVPYKRVWGYAGIGVRGNYSRLYRENDGYSLDGNLGMLHLLGVYQLPLFKRRVLLELHGGAGITYFNNIKYHFAHSIDSDALNTINISLDAGASIQFYINKRLYTEMAADYVFTKNSDMILGVIIPSAGIGWQF